MRVLIILQIMSLNNSTNEANQLKVVTTNGTSSEITALLQKTIFGTKGKIRYRQKHIANSMATKKNLEFIQIRKTDKTLGTTGVVTRAVKNGLDELTSFYIRYLSVRNPFRNGQSHPSRFSPKKRTGTGSLKKMIENKITSHFEQPIIDAGSKAAFYAFVESDNRNSKNLCIELGFYPLRKISTVLFSRFLPKTHPSVSTAKLEDQGEISKQLTDLYVDHSFYFEDELFETEPYYCFKKNGGILAGIRCKPVSWELVEAPGISGFLMQRILPYLPFTSKLFNSKEMNFLAFDYPFYSLNNESLILELMEHCSAKYGIHIGMFWGDTDDVLVNQLKSSKKLGFLYKLKGDVTAEVMYRFINFTKQEESELLKKPVFVSALDMT